MKKALTITLACLMLLSVFAACNSTSSAPPANSNPPAESGAPASDNTPNTSENAANQPPAPLPEGTEWNAETNTLRFTDTRKITVRLMERGKGGPAADKTAYADFIREGILRDHNVEVTYKLTPRDTEQADIGNDLAAGICPDVGVTYEYPAIQANDELGGIIDLYNIVTDNKVFLPNLWGLLGETYIYFDKDPVDNKLIAIEGIRLTNYKNNTFVREDWVNKLQKSLPTTMDEFHDLLIAFRDNAELLLGKDAGKMIPFTVNYDSLIRSDTLQYSFLPPDFSQKDFYIYGFDDRGLMWPTAKDAIRVLNTWYNEKLIWQDFYMYGGSDQTEANNINAGFVGSYIINWNEPYRIQGTDSTMIKLAKDVGPDAAFVAVDCFKNSAGQYRKVFPAANDRKIFFPVTNKEPLASMLYVDWVSRDEVRHYLNIGEEGINYTVNEDGSYKVITITDKNSPDFKYAINSEYNLDYGITWNGLNLGDTEEATARTASFEASKYEGTDPKYIQAALVPQNTDIYHLPNYQMRQIVAEKSKSNPLKKKRDTFVPLAISATTDKFDSVWDSGMADYLATGGKDIIDERTVAWQETWGDQTNPYPGS